MFMHTSVQYDISLPCLRHKLGQAEGEAERILCCLKGGFAILCTKEGRKWRPQMGHMRIRRNKAGAIDGASEDGK
jgi:hypothetical protein